MNKIFKGLGLGFLALALIMGVGVGSANATLTLEALAITSDGTLTLDGAATSAIALGSTQTTGALTLGAAHTSGAITIGAASQTGLTTIYGGGPGNAVSIIQTAANVGAANAVSRGLSVTSTGTFNSTGQNLIGVNSVLTPLGTGGNVAVAVYGKVEQSTSQSVSGYMSGGEFEIANTVTSSAATLYPLTLDLNSKGHHGNSAYIQLQDYGTALMPNLLYFAQDEVGGDGAGTLLSTSSASQDVTTGHIMYIKIMVGSTAYWILATDDAPAE